MWSLLFLSLLVGVQANSFGCPTNVTCIEKETCCQTSTGLWACCPLQDGTCCDDGLHCCAKGQKCLPGGQCSSSSNNISPAFPLRLGSNSVHTVPCPDKSTCPDGNTCCELASGQYGCCPLVDAVCCSDHLHCCPKGYVCDVKHSTCKKQFDDIKDVPCPDGKSACPDGETCCQLQSGQYGCCPLVDAVCCSDHLHCCPNGYVCDVEHSTCKKQFDDLNDVPCPGGKSACPDGETCCQLQSGEYGCCPLADAVCCSDHLHCCPHGYTCDVEKGECVRGISVPWFTKKPAFRQRHEYTNIIKDKETEIYDLKSSSKVDTEIVCPDATSVCPSTSTCCLAPDLTWGCCPVERAVCCPDHQHCCPQHYKCNLHVFKCDHSIVGSVPMLKKQPPLKKISNLILSNVPSSISTIQCPDERSYCPEETTCCELENGSYGCCPYPDASCCSDKIHCCGNGYSCDDSGKRCIRHFNGLNVTDIKPSTRKLVALKVKNPIQPLQPLSALKDQTCPDGKTVCSSGTTCCPNKDQNDITYSCCPYSKGVCCGSNGSVCCPNGYTCNAEQLSCQLNDGILTREAPIYMDYNRCGISDVACSYDQTCCRTYGSSDGEFACCTFPDAQCCEDGRHCCPKGSRCDVQSGGCIQN